MQLIREYDSFFQRIKSLDVEEHLRTLWLADLIKKKVDHKKTWKKRPGISSDNSQNLFQEPFHKIWVTPTFLFGTKDLVPIPTFHSFIATNICQMPILSQTL